MLGFLGLSLLAYLCFVAALTSVGSGAYQTLDQRLRMVPTLKRPTTLFSLVTDTSPYTGSLRWITDSQGDTTALLNSWMKDYYGANGDLSDTKSVRSIMLEAKVKSWVRSWGIKSNSWKTMFTKAFPQIKAHGERLNDTILVIPVGSHRIQRTWASLESLMTSTALPSEVVLLTGLKPTPVLEELHEFDYLAAVLYTIYEPLFKEKNVRLRWGVFSPSGGPAVARWMASNIGTEYEYVVYSDNDDYLTPFSLSYRINLLRQRPDIDLILNGYVPVDWTEVNFAKDDDLDALIRGMNVNSTKISRGSQDVAQDAASINAAKSRAAILSEFFVNSTMSFLSGSVVGWPALGYLGDDGCETMAGKVRDLQVKNGLVLNPPTDPNEDTPRIYNESIIDPISAYREEADLQYLKWACEIQWQLTPRYVTYCANGWGAIRRRVLKTLPSTVIKFGEDALVNFIAAASGFNVHCANSFSGAAYIRYGPNFEKS